MKHMEVSALTGENVEVMFQKLCSMVIKRKKLQTNDLEEEERLRNDKLRLAARRKEAKLCNC